MPKVPMNPAARREAHDSSHLEPQDRTHLFIDEAGNFDFSGRQGASRYFILTSVSMTDCQQADTLLELRRELVWDGLPLIDAFHATEDKQAVRDRVLQSIVQMDLRIDSLIIAKRGQNVARQESLTFYQHAWALHARNVIPAVSNSTQDLLVVAASLGTRNEQKTIGRAMAEAVHESGRSPHNTRVTYWPALSDPCLQVADYCCWAVQRKWERGDTRSHAQIEHLIASESLMAELSWEDW